MSARTTRPANTPDMLRNRLSARQLAMVLEQISTTADTLTNFAMGAAERAEGASQYDLHMVQKLAECIGTLADLPRDPFESQGAGSWFCGLHFKEADDVAPR